MKAAIISLGSESSEKLAEEMMHFFSVVDDLDIRDIEVTVGSGASGVLHKGKPFGQYDCVFIRGSFKYAAIQASIATKLYGTCYMPYSPHAFTIVHDKLLTHLELEKYNIPMPKTYLSSSPDAARSLLKQLTFPIIMKIPKGTQGKGVMFSDSYASATSMLDTLSTLKQPFLIQEYVETGGTDIRAIVVGDSVVACMKRKGSADDKRSNLHSGGTAESYVPTVGIKRIAVQTAKALQAEICGVDILEGLKSPLVIEANLSPGVIGISTATEINVAKKIASYLAEKTAEFLDKKEGNSELGVILESEGIPVPKKTEKQGIHNIITTLDFRGERVFIPKMASDAADLKENEDYVVEFGKGFISIRKL
jgi:ribosomal protein S6--L-glutamate ligase